MQVNITSMQQFQSQLFDAVYTLYSAFSQWLDEDWPHMEGLEHPRDIFDEMENIPLSVQTKILHNNPALQNQRTGG